MLKNRGIALKLYVLITAFIIIMTATGAISLLSLHGFNEQMTKDIETESKIILAVDMARSAQVTFKKQVQEWKNILLRGYEDEAYEKHLESFQNDEAAVQKELSDLKELMKELALDTSMVDETIMTHKKLGAKYSEALKSYQADVVESPRIIDKLVKGIDRAPTDNIDSIVKQIEEYASAKQQESKTENAETYGEFKFRIIGIIIASVIICVLLGVTIAIGITRPLNNLKNRISDIAELDGDLTQKLDVKGKDETAMVAEKFNLLLEKIRNTVSAAAVSATTLSKEAAELSDTTTNVHEATIQISHTVEDITKGNQELASEVTNVSLNLNGINRHAQDAAKDMMTVIKQFDDAKDAVESGKAAVTKQSDHMVQTISITNQVADTVKILENKAMAINSIVQTISSIAGQTNLLALNAAIEAARAGENGKGFAVVAEEVRKLAESSGKATEEVFQHVNEIMAAVEATITQVNLTGDTIKTQVETVDRTRYAFDEISKQVAAIMKHADATNERMQEVTSQVGKLDNALQNISAIAEETAAATEQALASTQEQSAGIESINTMTSELSAVSNDLRSIVQRFRY